MVGRLVVVAFGSPVGDLFVGPCIGLDVGSLTGVLVGAAVKGNPVVGEFVIGI